ncbi:hypothetical protein Patl1_26413 [Pistacia atlantica]|uniref:Uncharacterized protein n=1 Tax=Pistacia atlantica TaxID=434234 RepID=A0ACC1AZR7_9ROSI|nr:hypothetical protein Patl1_26413 [Pistacia atlantica]
MAKVHFRNFTKGFFSSQFSNPSQRALSPSGEERKAEARAGIMKDRHWLTVKGKKKKQRFANADERLKHKLEKAKVKQALLIERLKQYEAPKVQGSMYKPHDLTGEECFYFTKMAQKDLTMCQLAEEHWEKHETVEVICKLQAL